MQHVNHLKQAYYQAPWRQQIQWIGGFLLALVALWIVAAIYLDVTARAAAVGREVQEMQVSDRSLSVYTPTREAQDRWSMEELRQEIEDLQSQYAALTSDQAMRARAEEMGFQPLGAGEWVYLQVEGYQPPQEARLAPPPGPDVPSEEEQPVPQTLLDWLRDELFRTTETLMGPNP